MLPEVVGLGQRESLITQTVAPPGHSVPNNPEKAVFSPTSCENPLAGVFRAAKKRQIGEPRERPAGR